jgi:hypothetical protein
VTGIDTIKGNPLSNPSYMFDALRGFERGFPFVDSDYNWQFISTNTNGTYNWYVFAQTLRQMTAGLGVLTIY